MVKQNVSLQAPADHEEWTRVVEIGHMEMEKSVVLVSLCCFFAHIWSRPGLLLSTDRVPRQTVQPQRTSAAALRSIFKASASVNARLLSKQRRRFTIEASGGRTKPDSVQGISLSSSPPTPRRAQPPERPSALRWLGSMHYVETLPFRKGGYPSFPPIWCASAARQQVPKSRFQ